jgi:hypothetical protein
MVTGENLRVESRWKITNTGIDGHRRGVVACYSKSIQKLNNFLMDKNLIRDLLHMSHF